MSQNQIKFSISVYKLRCQPAENTPAQNPRNRGFYPQSPVDHLWVPCRQNWWGRADLHSRIRRRAEPEWKSRIEL
jgi:hypothetical protein